MRVAARVTVRVLEGFDDPSFGPEDWTRLAASGPTDVFDLTWPVQRAWWETQGHGDLLLVVASRDGEDIALAPLFTAGDMIFNLASKDRLDIIGDVTDPAVLDALLSAARAQVPAFQGFRFYFVSDASPLPQLLQAAAARLDLTCVAEDQIPAPALRVAGNESGVVAATRKQSLRRHERYFTQSGTLTVTHFTDGAEIHPQLEEFFAQHVERRRATPHPSLFEEPRAREFYRRMTQLAADTGWLRFTRVEWDSKPVAFHYGSCYRGRYLYGIPSFDIGLARRSPGEVLLRHLLLDALEEGADVFDFGIGDEQYKYRFADHETLLRTWGLYPG